MPRDSTTTLPQPVFNEGNITRDPMRFATAHPSDGAQYRQLGNLTQKDTVSFDPSTGDPGGLYTLQQAFGAHGPELIKRIVRSGKIVFHAAGDTGVSNEGKYANEISVADQVTADCRTSDDANRPAFFYHLGDVVYSFGESQYYYDQFYEPYRDYPAPIFAVPGNHDSFVIPGTSSDETPLKIFRRNFCAPQPQITVEARSLHRTAMTQPGVYFTLDAPYVRIIGLFSNALEDPGVISSEGNRWPGVPDVQLDYLSKQLESVKRERYSGVVLIAVHHPPFSYAPRKGTAGAGGHHGSSPNMLRQIDTICKQEGVYPHAVLSGHAHNYQRFQRNIRFSGKPYEVPFIVCGDGGHNVNRLVKGRRGQTAPEPRFGSDVSYLEARPAFPAPKLVLKHYDDSNYGYLRITVDAKQLKITFHHVGKGSLAQSQIDATTVDIASHKIVAS